MKINNFIFKGKICLIYCFFIYNSISCENWLKPEPLSFYTPENTYTTKDGLEGALVACRAMIRPEFIGNNSYNCTELMTSDIAVAGNIVAQTLKILKFN